MLPFNVIGCAESYTFLLAQSHMVTGSVVLCSYMNDETGEMQIWQRKRT